MDSTISELFLIVVLIVLNGVFAMSEIALISARKSRLEQRAASGNQRAAIALELANSPSQFLSTVQIGITGVGVLAGAYGGANLAEKLAVALAGIPKIGPYKEAIAFGTVVAGITYLSLVIGELVPKRLALVSPERIAAAVAGPMRFLAKLAAPVVHLLTFSTDATLRLLNIRPAPEPPVTEEEIRMLIDLGTRAGVFHPEEQELIKRAFQLADRPVSLLMTPRTEIVWLDISDPIEEAVQRINAARYSRYPVAERMLDSIIGIVRAKDLLSQLAERGRLELRSALKEALFVPESLPAIKLMELFKKSALHMALVVDEYGSVQGLVTHHDILEAVVGEIVSVSQPDERLVIVREDGSWLIDGMLPIEDFKGVTGVSRLPGEETPPTFLTLAGFILHQLGRVPSTGDRFDVAGLRFEVVDMDGRRIDKILVTPASKPIAGA